MPAPRTLQRPMPLLSGRRINSPMHVRSRRAPAVEVIPTSDAEEAEDCIGSSDEDSSFNQDEPIRLLKCGSHNASPKPISHQESLIASASSSTSQASPRPTRRATKSEPAHRKISPKASPSMPSSKAFPTITALTRESSPAGMSKTSAICQYAKYLLTCSLAKF